MRPVYLYIDPGTGSMLFTVFLGIAATAVFFAQSAFLKLKFLIQGGKTQEAAAEKIPYVIFSEGKRYWNVFQPVCEEFERRKVKLEYWTATPDDPALDQKYQYVSCRFIGEGNKAFAKLNMMNAGICLSTTPGLDVYQWKRSRNTDWYVHIFHSLGEGVGYRMFGLDYYDAVLTTGKIQNEYIRKIERKRGIEKKELTVVGSTYMDVMKQRLDRTEPLQKREKITVLVGPTWGESGILSRLGENFIDSLLGTDFNIIIRPHPQSRTSEAKMLERLQAKYPDSERLQWNFDRDNFDVLNRSDILISDFSGVIYDFALVFGKPIIYADTSFNSAPYDAAWIDEPLWRFTALERMGRRLDEKDFDHLQEIIEDVVRDSTYEKGRKSVCAEDWDHIGEAAARTADYLIRKGNELKKNGEELGLTKAG